MGTTLITDILSTQSHEYRWMAFNGLNKVIVNIPTLHHCLNIQTLVFSSGLEKVLQRTDFLLLVLNTRCAFPIFAAIILSRRAGLKMPVPESRLLFTGAGEPRITLFWTLKHILLAFPEPDASRSFCWGDKALFLELNLASAGGLLNLQLLNSILLNCRASGVPSTCLCAAAANGVAGIELNVAIDLLGIWIWDRRDTDLLSGNMDSCSLWVGSTASEDRLLGCRGMCRITGVRETRRALPATALLVSAPEDPLFIMTGMFSLFWIVGALLSLSLRGALGGMWLPILPRGGLCLIGASGGFVDLAVSLAAFFSLANSFSSSLTCTKENVTHR